MECQRFFIAIISYIMPDVHIQGTSAAENIITGIAT